MDPKEAFWKELSSLGKTLWDTTTKLSYKVPKGTRRWAFAIIVFYAWLGLEAFGHCYGKSGPGAFWLGFGAAVCARFMWTAFRVWNTPEEGAPEEE